MSGYLTPEEDVVAIVDAPPTPMARRSPDGTKLLFVHYSAMPPLSMVAEPFHRLGGLRINKHTGTTRRLYDLTHLSIMDLTTREVRELPTPEHAERLAMIAWSPDANHIAYTALTPAGLELWVTDLDSATTRRLGEFVLNDTLVDPIRWMPGSRSILVACLPDGGRGPVPEEALVPTGPIVEETVGREAKNRTYQDLLETDHDDALFEHFSTAQLKLVELSGAVRDLGAPGMFAFAAPSPDASHFLVKRFVRPFSHVVPVGYFGHKLEIWDASGGLVRELAHKPAADEIPIQGVPKGVRRAGWQPLQGATIGWAEALDGGDPSVEAEHRDRLMMLSAPFDGEPVERLRVEHRYRGVQWLETPGHALITEYDRDRRWVTTRLYDLGGGDREGRVLFDRSVHDQYGDPGRPVYRRLADATSVVEVRDHKISLLGAGATPTGDRPFLDHLDLETGATERVYQSGEDAYTVFLGYGPEGPEGRAMLLRRESVGAPANDLLRSPDGTEHWLTHHKDPHPHLTGITKRLLTYERADGTPLSGMLYLPPGYDPDSGEKLPVLVWAYPLEYNDRSTAGQVRARTNTFTRLGGTSPLMFLTQGYAVLNDATMPVVGDPETMNDTFIEQIVGAAQAAVDAVVAEGVGDPERVAVGGHSYGAFMTANLLAHSNVFKAGLARSGAYNRSLTPFGFQGERRTMWEARDTYIGLSSLFVADTIKAPLLLIHGDADSNSGTYPLQTRRLFHALKGLGGTARMVILPHESHGYRSRESILHVLAESFAWFKRFV